jgi:hypothetical protein
MRLVMKLVNEIARAFLGEFTIAELIHLGPADLETCLFVQLSMRAGERGLSHLHMTLWKGPFSRDGTANQSYTI